MNVVAPGSRIATSKPFRARRGSVGRECDINAPPGVYVVNRYDPQTWTLAGPAGAKAIRVRITVSKLEAMRADGRAAIRA